MVGELRHASAGSVAGNKVTGVDLPVEPNTWKGDSGCRAAIWNGRARTETAEPSTKTALL